MEPLMIRAVAAARKLRRPVREDYIPPVDKVQNFLNEADTGGAQRMEQAIVAGAKIGQG